MLHSEQAAQLLLKGLLRGVGAAKEAWGHALSELAERTVAAADLELSDELQKRLIVLERDCVPTRYPDALVSGTPLGNYAQADADRVLETLTRLQDVVIATWEHLVDDERTPILQATPKGMRRDSLLDPSSARPASRRAGDAGRVGPAVRPTRLIRSWMPEQWLSLGSVARGDFHDNSSDVGVLVVADGLPERALERNAMVGLPPPRVQFVAWTPNEWRRERDRGNPIAVGAGEHGLVLRGALD